MKKLKTYWSLPLGLRNIIHKEGVEGTLEIFARLEEKFIKQGDEDMAMRPAKTQREIREAVEWSLQDDFVH